MSTLVLPLLVPSETTAKPALQVEFDTSELVAVRDVTTPAFTAAHPGEKLIEVRFQLSSLLRQGGDEELVHVLHQISVVDDGMRVVDYLPKTELATSVVGQVCVEEKSNDAYTIGGEVASKFEAPVAAKLNASRTAGQQSAVKYALLPPKELIAASGTIRRQHGVYFKLKPSPQTSLEGAKEFVCLLAVPQSWRAGRVRIQCEATAMSPATLAAAAKESTCGRAEFFVGIHMPADAEAKDAVQRMLRGEAALARAEQSAADLRRGERFGPLRLSFEPSSKSKQAQAAVEAAAKEQRKALDALKRLNSPPSASGQAWIRK